MTSLLEVEDLTVTVHTDAGDIVAVERASLSLLGGERVGIVGESGSGKSMVLRALLGLLPPHAEMTGSIRWQGEELVGSPPGRLAALRGQHIGFIPQDPMTALNPVRRIGAQLAEGPRIHRRMSRHAAGALVPELLEQVGLPDVDRIARSYPHQLSGGQRQRVLTAMALSGDPALLLCDEPTTALDVTVQAQVLDLIRSRADAAQTAVAFVSHDLAVVSQLCSAVYVMYAGQVVERGPLAAVFDDPRHAYTAALLAALPTAGSKRARLASIPGELPDRVHRPEGCRIHRRCTVAGETCPDEPYRLRAVAGDRLADRPPARIGTVPERGSSCYYDRGLPVAPVSDRPAVSSPTVSGGAGR
ncbi:MAG: ABC transporter ATP-binding protein [Microbacteriaceae bacterium]